MVNSPRADEMTSVLVVWAKKKKIILLKKIQYIVVNQQRSISAIAFWLVGPSKDRQRFVRCTTY